MTGRELARILANGAYIYFGDIDDERMRDFWMHLGNAAGEAECATGNDRLTRTQKTFLNELMEESSIWMEPREEGSVGMEKETERQLDVDLAKRLESKDKRKLNSIEEEWYAILQNKHGERAIRTAGEVFGQTKEEERYLITLSGSTLIYMDLEKNNDPETHNPSDVHSGRSEEGRVQSQQDPTASGDEGQDVPESNQG